MQRRSIAICAASTVFVILAAVIAIICVVFVNNNETNDSNESNTQEGAIGYVSSSLDDNSIIIPWNDIDDKDDKRDVNTHFQDLIKTSLNAKNQEAGHAA